MKTLNRVSKYCIIIGVLVVFFLLSGCSMKFGTVGEKTHFAYPNSNVQPIGHVQSMITKTGFFFPPLVTGEDVRTLIDQALSQKAGADFVINPQVDTKITTLFIYYELTMTLSGTAASMEIGRQE
jgi:hypothetical protein